MNDQNPSPPVKGALFEHAIKHKDYGYFLGTARPIWRENFSPRRQEAYTYTEQGAHIKMSKFPHAFRGCSVVNVG